MNWDKTVPTDFLGYPILDEYQETIVHSDGFHIFFTCIKLRVQIINEWFLTNKNTKKSDGS